MSSRSQKRKITFTVEEGNSAIFRLIFPKGFQISRIRRFVQYNEVAIYLQKGGGNECKK